MSSGAWMSSNAVGGPTAFPGCGASTPRASRSSSPTRAGSPGCTRPRTGIVDFAAVARSYARDVLEAGATVASSCGVRRGRPWSGARCASRTRTASTEAAHAVFCAGAWADRLAVAAGADPDPRIVPFRGAYLRLAPARRGLVPLADLPRARPVAALPRRSPDQAHRRRGADRTDGAAGRRPRRLQPRDAPAPGPARHARLAGHVADARAAGGRPGATELRHAASRGRLRARRRSLRAGPAGRRRAARLRRRSRAGARARRPAGRRLRRSPHTERALHVRNAPSPAATSSLAIARHVADRAGEAFGLAR